LTAKKNTVPWFITQNGPIREARFKLNPGGTPGGGVHAIFTIAGRSDAMGCGVSEPDFLPAGDPQTGQGGNSNIIFRIPTPVFGAGLIEAIPDAEILLDKRSHWDLRWTPGSIPSHLGRLQRAGVWMIQDATGGRGRPARFPGYGFSISTRQPLRVS